MKLKLFFMDNEPFFKNTETGDRLSKEQFMKLCKETTIGISRLDTIEKIMIGNTVVAMRPVFVDIVFYVNQTFDNEKFSIRTTVNQEELSSYINSLSPLTV